MSTFQILRVNNLTIEEIKHLIDECTLEGFTFMTKLQDEYVTGQNRFDKRGEALYVARFDHNIVGICGLNQDPYEKQSTIGRVRHLYVAKEFRKQRIARALVSQIIYEAKEYYLELTLRTNNPEADRLYRSMGFSTESNYESATHILPLLTGNSG
ncbi:GNAT family N-acetyltransferase [Brevibacillus sp. SYSU BS000544]|uniref:GNAT family N-acetyltransferase n=1 Tax=Brevibacillus sp. SYSU BS000544 TaxID=3416443 RepID=UPI003CE47D1C